MKKSITVAFGCLIVALLLTGCNSNNGITGTHLSKNFIQLYVVPDDIDIYHYKTLTPETSRSIWVTFRGESVFDRIINGKHDLEYIALSTKYNDLSYNGYVTPASNPTLAGEVRDIDVTCNVDIDESHPAGSSLNDIIKIHAGSPKAFINSGYKKYNNKLTDEFGMSSITEYGYEVIFKYLNELKPGDLDLIHDKCILYITKELPKGSYDFTVTMKCMGNTLEKTVTLELE